MRRYVYILLALLCAGPVLAADYCDTLDQGQNADGMFDTRIRENSPYFDYNYGATSPNILSNASGARQRILVWFNNWDTAVQLHGAGTVIDSAFIEMYCEADTNETISMYELLKPTYLTTTTYEGAKNASQADQGEITWTSWWWDGLAHTNDSSWSISGADSASDAGTQNRATGNISYDNAPASCGGQWRSCGNTYISDNSRADETTAPQTMTLTNFTCGIPSAATISDITLKYEGYSTLAGGHEITINLTKDGSSTVGTDWPLTIAQNTVDDNYTDDVAALWGTTWTAAEVNATTFGVMITNNTAGASLYCDQVLITVTYTWLGADRKATAMATATAADGEWSRWKIDTAVMRDWIDGDKLPWGVIFISNVDNTTNFTMSEGTAANRPRWIIYSHLDVATTGGGRRRRMLLGGE